MINGDRIQLPRSAAGLGLLLPLNAFVRFPGMIEVPDRFGVPLARLLLHTACRTWPYRMLPHRAVDASGPRGPVRGEWVSESTARPRAGPPIVYYLHGSGYVGCSPATHRGLVSELVRRLRRPAFVLRYRLAPEHRFPAAHDDVLGGYLWLLEQGYAARDIVVIGDSVGGHLALGLGVQLRELGVAQPAGVVGFSALVDASWKLAAAREPQVWDSFMTVRTARRITGLYTEGADLTDPRLDVAHAVGPDSPPTLLQAGGSEILAADAEHYAAALRGAGGECELETWPGMFHVFQMMYGLLPEAREALDSVGRFVEGLAVARPGLRVAGM
jgi:acetyl esterase/lipase